MGKASLNPETFSEGGGLIDDVDATIKEARFELFDYNGKARVPAPCLKISLDMEDADPADQYYSMGSAEAWTPSDDGKSLEAVGRATSIRADSNGGIFLKSLMDAGFPSDELGEDISVLDGLNAHFIQVPAPERKGVKKSDEQKAREEKYGPPTILVISEILSMPGEAKKPKGKPASKSKAKTGGKAAKPKEAPTEASEKDIEGKASAAILEVLADNPTITKKELPAKIFQLASMKSDPDRNKVIQLSFDDAFLETGPWTYEDGTLISG